MRTITLPIKFEAIVTRSTIDGDLEVLGLKRTANDGGFWQPVTGTLESHESLEACIQRELEEETGITSGDILRTSDCFYEFTWERNGTVYSEYVFHVEVQSDTLITLSKEHTDYQWIPLSKSVFVFEKENNKNAIRKLEKILYG